MLTYVERCIGDLILCMLTYIEGSIWKLVIIMHTYIKGVLKELYIRWVSTTTSKEIVRYATWGFDIFEIVINCLVQLISSFQITSVMLIILITCPTLDVRTILIDEIASWHLDNRRASGVNLASPEDEVRVL